MKLFYDPAQSLAIPEALRMFTFEVAWTSFEQPEQDENGLPHLLTNQIGYDIRFQIS